MSPSPQPDLARQMREMGVAEGDFLLVHSRMESAALPEVVSCLNALIRSVGPTGTLAIPTFTFGFCAGEAFDHRKTPSQMGLLTEIARRDPRSRRSFHPIYSVALFGPEAETLSRSVSAFSSFNDDSIFGLLRKRDGKILLIGLAIHECLTYFHHVEEMTGCDYRFLKVFSGPVIDESGRETTGSCQMLVRNLDMGVETDVAPMAERLSARGLVRHGALGRWSALLLEAGPVFEATKEVPRKEPHLLRRLTKPSPGNPPRQASG